MTTPAQRSAAKRNVHKAAAAARDSRSLAALPKKTRSALGHEGAKAAAAKRRKTTH